MLLKVSILLILSIIFLILIIKFRNIKIIKGIIIISLVFIVSLTYKIGIKYFNYKNDITKSIMIAQDNIKVLEASINSNQEEKEELEHYLNDYDYNDLELKLDELYQEQKELDAVIKEKENYLEEQNSEYKSLTNEINLLKQIKVVIDNFPTYNQYPEYPNGCEVVSLYLMLKYYNVDVDLETLVDELPKGDAPYMNEGVIVGGDPEIEYLGDPHLSDGKGYGVYQKPIIELANKYKSGMKDITGSSLSNVLKLVNKGMPVQVWASVNMKNTKICLIWETYEEKKVSWMCGLHSLVIIGFTHNQVITSDPYNGTIKYYDRTQFEKMYNQYGKRAIYYEK